MARKKPMRSARPSVSQEGPQAPSLPNTEASSLDPRCGGSRGRAQAGGPAFDPRPADLSPSSAVSAPSWGTAAAPRGAGVGSDVSQPCAPTFWARASFSA